MDKPTIPTPHPQDKGNTLKSPPQGRLEDIYQLVGPHLDAFESTYRELLRPVSNNYIRLLTDHVSTYQGKRLRPILVLLAGAATGELGSDHAQIACAVEAMHVATLVHDDVLDEADMRRRHETVNAKWGNEVSVLLGDYLFSRSFVQCSQLGRAEVSTRFSQISTQVCEGELLQIAERNNAELDETRYLRIIELKTASLTAFACEVGAHLSDARPEVCEAMYSFGRHIGIAFQIADDCLDIVGEEKLAGKSLGTDLQKGKVTLPLIRLLSIAPPKVTQQVAKIISSGTGHADRARVESWVREFGCVEHAEDRAAEHVAAAKKTLAVLPTNPFRDAMETLADFVIRRSV